MAQRSPCGPAAGAAERPGDSRPCHFLYAPRSSAWLRAGARLWRRRRGLSGKPRCAFMWAGGSRHARPAHAHSLPGAAAAGASAATCSQSGFFRTQSARPWGGMCSPAGAAPRLVSQSASLRKVKINHRREGLRRNLLEDLWSQLQSTISSC